MTTEFFETDRRYLALWFAFLPTDRLRIAQPKRFAEQADAPLAMVEKVKGAMRLAAVDATAASLGLTPGMTLADARARVPDLTVADLDPHADQDWLERLADGCLRYTPQVALDPPHGLVLDITGCTHLFGDEGALAEDIVARLERLGLAVRHATAANARAAHALARYQTTPAADEAAAIRRLPTAALDLDEDDATALRRAGLKTVGDVACRPMAGIAARFGARTVGALRRITGDEDSPIVARIAIPEIALERRFAEPIARTEYALQILGELADQAVILLERRDSGGRRFEALFFRSDGLVRRLRVEAGLPTRDRHAMMRLFAERVEALADPIDPGFGFDLIRLSVPLAESLAATQLRLEGGATADVQVAALIDRLSTRLGRARLRRFTPGDSNIPEQAELLLPAATAAKLAAWPPSELGEPPLRPLHMFDPPQPIDVMAEVPDGPPRRFRWRRTLHDVARFEGPERIAAQWWRKTDGLTRDYYRVEDVRGRRFWIFRHGLYGSERAMPGWYLHGLFA